MQNKLYYYLEKSLKYILNFFTTILLLLLVITSLKALGFKINFITVKNIQIISILLQILSIGFSIVYDFVVKYNIFHAILVYNMIGNVKEKTIVQRSRGELRVSLGIIVAVAICGTLYQFLITNNLLIFITILLILYVGYIYADYLPYTILCGKFYDSKFLKKGEKAKMNRGLARIYLDEYKITKFDRKHKFYDENFKNIEYEENYKYQDECIREILRNWADYLTAPDIVLNLIMFIINFVMLIASTQVEDIVKLYIPSGLSLEVKELILIIFIIVINTIFSYISYKGINTCRKSNEKTKEICDIIKSHDKKKRFEFFKNEYKNISPTVLSRGTYEFNIYYTTGSDINDNLNEIKLPYKTLFVDRYYSHKQRFDMTSKAVMLMLFFGMLTFTVPFFIVIIAMLICIILTLILKKYWLPNIGRKKVSRECEKLLTH